MYVITRYITSLIIDMQNTIGIFDAKTKFTMIIDKVVSGNEFIITKHNKPVAKVVSIDKERSNVAREAAMRIRKLAKEIGIKKFDWEEWKSYRDEERK